MINLTLMWMLVVPILLSAISLIIVPKILKSASSLTQNLCFAGGGIVISLVIFSACLYMAVGIKTHDTEILNGEITGKQRVHDTYQESYNCNCRQVRSCSGSGTSRSCSTSEVCDTCYRTHYTVAWNAAANIGSWKIHGLDSLDNRIYKETDPVRYALIKNGDPAAIEHSYTNYIKAVPQTLFRPTQAMIKDKYAASIPTYPDSTFDFYKINRVIPVGVNIPNISEWNEKLSIMLKTLGPLKQANVVVVIAKFDDPEYFYALQDAWVNGKKNDVVVVIGAPKFPQQASWVNVMALTDSDIIRVSIRDDILNLSDLSVDNVLRVIDKNVKENFKRKSMKDFSYLESEIDPPAWLIYSALIVDVIAYLGFWLVLFKHNPVYSNRRLKYNKF